MTGDSRELSQEKPLSHGTLRFLALQHIAIIAPIGLVFPLLVLRAADAGFAWQERVITASLLALGTGNLLLCLMRHFADSVRMVQCQGQQQVKLVLET